MKAALKPLLASLDKNKNGFVDKEEFAQLVSCGGEVSNTELDDIWLQMVEKADKNGDGKISMEEYMQCMCEYIDSEEQQAWSQEQFDEMINNMKDQMRAAGFDV